jgi:hypothetical protein
MGSTLRRLRKQFPLGTLALEVFSIVLGVLLALGANEWRKHANQQDLKQRTLRMIGEDAMENRRILARRIELHDALKADVEVGAELLSQGVTTFPDSLRQLNFGIIPLNTSAYETARAAQVIPLLDLEIALVLARMHEIIRINRGLEDAMRDAAYSLDYYAIFQSEQQGTPASEAALGRSFNAFINMGNSLGDMVRNERGLHRGFGELLRRLHADGIAVDTTAGAL